MKANIIEETLRLYAFAQGLKTDRWEWPEITLVETTHENGKKARQIQIQKHRWAWPYLKLSSWSLHKHPASWVRVSSRIPADPETRVNEYRRHFPGGLSARVRGPCPGQRARRSRTSRDQQVCEVRHGHTRAPFLYLACCTQSCSIETE